MGSKDTKLLALTIWVERHSVEFLWRFFYHFKTQPKVKMFDSNGRRFLVAAFPHFQRSFLLLVIVR
jgi:hypothetical protein